MGGSFLRRLQNRLGLLLTFVEEKSIVVFHDTGWSEGVNKLISESVITVADKILELPNMRAFRIN